MAGAGNNVGEDADWEGWMHKQGDYLNTSWEKRYFVLKGDTLWRYKSKYSTKESGIYTNISNVTAFQMPTSYLGGGCAIQIRHMSGFSSAWQTLIAEDEEKVMSLVTKILQNLQRIEPGFTPESQFHADRDVAEDQQQTVLEELKRAYVSRVNDSSPTAVMEKIAKSSNLSEFYNALAQDPQIQASSLVSRAMVQLAKLACNPATILISYVVSYAIVGGIAQGYGWAKIASYALWQLKVTAVAYGPYLTAATSAMGILTNVFQGMTKRDSSSGASDKGADDEATDSIPSPSGAAPRSSVSLDPVP
mmetsp:Transcript_841/g.2532  ORF Transcript_841/g.2532 Transcript_841/m.2532 type:complete len:305 (+) Transcript_841:254-1168(+)|eukprot:CAMPEP_0117667960 /NCGR_PEP_ID=MMETSP0804-20121206/11264_1 /TAXON_ID=1074897 /ORGANISM="Tetraselmis astigmatica, Strain CCMP880" /LENGTH=304 /DNA_ID=CAMNT_0005475759 /DNA_START=260 /DNA_END=1174 /DNA_ORIENTATION=-